MEKKPAAKITCNVCKHDFRSDNLMRHVYTHRNTMASFIDPDRMKYCVEKRLPIMFPNEKDWIMCLVCRKTAHVGGRGLTVKEFIANYGSLHSKCISCYDTVKDLFEAPKNVILESIKPITDNTELLDLQKKYATLQTEYNTVDNSYTKYIDESEDTINELKRKYQKEIDYRNEIVDLIRQHITDEDTLELFADYI